MSYDLRGLQYWNQQYNKVNFTPGLTHAWNQQLTRLKKWLEDSVGNIPTNVSETGHKIKLSETAQEKWPCSWLYHYAIFSDNILATTVVVNSSAGRLNVSYLHIIFFSFFIS